MKNPMLAERTLLRYALLQLPGITVLFVVLLLIRGTLGLPFLWMAVIMALWVAKDMILYPFVWRAYGTPATENKNPLAGARGVVRVPLDPAGYIQVNGELWRARVPNGRPPIQKEETVEVVEKRGVELLVTPIRKHSPQGGRNNDLK